MMRIKCVVEIEDPGFDMSETGLSEPAGGIMHHVRRLVVATVPRDEIGSRRITIRAIRKGMIGLSEWFTYPNIQAGSNRCDGLCASRCRSCGHYSSAHWPARLSPALRYLLHTPEMRERRRSG